MVATTVLVVAEAAKYCRVLIWNVRNEHETSGWFWICVGMVIAILMVLSDRLSANPISTDWSRQKVTDENAAWRRPLRKELVEHRTRGGYSRSGQMMSARIVWTAARIIPSAWNVSSAEHSETTV